MNALCWMNIHLYKWSYVGNGATPNDHVRACVRCGLGEP